MISREKEMVVRRVEDSIKYDKDLKKVTVGYPWTEEVYNYQIIFDKLRTFKRLSKGGCYVMGHWIFITQSCKSSLIGVLLGNLVRMRSSLMVVQLAM